MATVRGGGGGASLSTRDSVARHRPPANPTKTMSLSANWLPLLASNFALKPRDRMNFETLPERARATSLLTGESYEAALHVLFADCLVHYNKITAMCAVLHEVFGIPLLVQFGVGGWILCMAAYKIISLNVLSIEFASTTLFIICILTELFLFCYYGNEVTTESGRVSESVYSMEWRHTGLSFRRSLVLVMERAKRPLRPAAGLVIPLSLETYVTILKSSYSFYAVLRQTK